MRQNGGNQETVLVCVQTHRQRNAKLKLEAKASWRKITIKGRKIFFTAIWTHLMMCHR